MNLVLFCFVFVFSLCCFFPLPILCDNLAITSSVSFSSVLSPYDVTIDGSGNVYVVSQGGNAVVQYSPAGAKLNTWGPGFQSPNGVSFDVFSGNLYVADTTNNLVRVVSITGPTTGTIINSLSGSFNAPTRVVTDSAGNVYVADWNNGRVVKFNSAGTQVSTYTGFTKAFGVAVDGSNNLYILDDSDRDVTKFDSTGTLVGSYVVNLPTAGSPAYRGISAGSDGSIFVSDNTNHQILKYSPSGNLLHIYQDAGLTPHGLYYHTGTNTVYVANQPNNEARKYALPAEVNGDPQFQGFQGQNFQFHGLVDEIFNLVSFPQLQLNAHFVYLASGGVCNYAETVCWQHPGTYLDVLGITIRTITGHVLIKIVAGSHSAGLRVWMGRITNAKEIDDQSVLREIKRKQQISFAMNNNETAHIHYQHDGSVSIQTPTFHIKVVNSDLFFNLMVALLDGTILRAGSTRHSITDDALCNHKTHQHNNNGEKKHTDHHHDEIQQQVAHKYPIDVPLSGLVGGTWRNIVVCGRHYLGGVQDYVTTTLFGNDYFYQNYQY